MIKIDIKKTDKNRRKFATIALTIDRDDLLVEVIKIRKKYQINAEKECPHIKHNREYFEGLLSKKLDNTELLRLWFAIEYHSLHRILRDKQVYKPDPEHQRQQITALLNNIAKLRYKDDKTRVYCDSFAKTVDSLRKKLNLSPQMEKVVAHAILCNLVKVDDLQPAYAYTDFEQSSAGDYNRLKDFVMRISLQATLKDVTNAYNRDIKPFQVPAYGIDTTIPLSTKDEVFRDRERYWLNKQGLGYKMIAAEEVGLAKYKRAKKTYRTLKKIPNTSKQRIERQEAERFINRVESLTPGIKKSVQRYKTLLRKTVQNLPSK